MAKRNGHITKQAAQILYIVASIALCLTMVCMPISKPTRESEPSELLAEDECEISIYDNIFCRVGKTYRIDWRLLSAMAYHESRFNDTIISPRGAIGLMQVMPNIGKSFGVEAEQLRNPVCNIEVAAQLIKSIRKMLNLPRRTADEDRTALMLACYNGGYSHITDARNLAAYYGDDNLTWATVEEYLDLLSSPDFYQHDAVCHGRFVATETISYVNKVIATYKQYCRKVAE